MRIHFYTRRSETRKSPDAVRMEKTCGRGGGRSLNGTADGVFEYQWNGGVLRIVGKLENLICRCITFLTHPVPCGVFIIILLTIWRLYAAYYMQQKPEWVRE